MIKPVSKLAAEAWIEGLGEVLIELKDNEIARLTARVEELEGALKSHDAIDRRRLAARLAARYNANPLKIAELCDEAIDPSGRLLGYVREEARAAIIKGGSRD